MFKSTGNLEFSHRCHEILLEFFTPRAAGPQNFDLQSAGVRVVKGFSNEFFKFS